MIAVTAAALLGAPVAPPVRLRGVVMPVLGVMLGAGFTPELLSRLGDWALSLALLPVSLALSLAVSFALYRRIGRFDPVTAYFAAAPGSVSDMVVIGGAAGGDERRIALSHACRIFLVIGFVGLIFGGASADAPPRPYVGFADLPATELALLAGAAIAGVWLGRRLRLPAPQILGPMIVSAAIHLAGISDAPPPTSLVNLAQLVLGTTIGGRFVGARLRDVARDMALGAVASGLMLAVAFASAWAVSALTGIDAVQAFLAFSPAGLAEMSLLALAMDHDAAYVATIQIFRVAAVILTAPVIFRWTRQRG